MSTDLDITRYLELIHSSPPALLGRLLSDLLAEPEERLEHLRVFVPEVCLLLSRLLIAQDLEGATALSQALEGALTTRDLDLESPGYFGHGLSPQVAQLLAYYVGRLRSLTVMARRVPVLDIPGHVLAELRDGGENQAVLAVLAARGATSVRNLRLALRDELPEGAVPSPEELHRRMTWLVRVGVVELQQNKRSLLYGLSPLGRRLLEEHPPWLSAVADVYRAYRQGRGDLPTPFGRTLEQIFRGIDRELETSS